MTALRTALQGALEHGPLNPWAGEIDRLHAFAELLAERAIPMGLVAESDRERIVERHMVDSLRAAVLFEPGDRVAVDIGAGAGLPGLVLAIAVGRCRFRLIEPKKRAAGFLELAADHLGLTNVDVVTQRIEHVTGRCDLATARAFAPPARAWQAAYGILRPGGRLIYFGGREWAQAAVKETNEDLLELLADIAIPEPPAEVRLEAVIENHAPLVIMGRRE
ncbi:MAG TPA: RsmG family class I SAM-dependent methyltransferase [Actinomycetota bacterium]|nr:RsmG family class I SAM-dependent methyltransferase [Actinomycetota bacterium]